MENQNVIKEERGNEIKEDEGRGRESRLKKERDREEEKGEDGRGLERRERNGGKGGR